VASAADGVVEAVEAPGPRFVLGVQWHAEGLIGRAEQLALLASFVDAARDHVSGVHVRAA
jgi:putative glutamine amidotransferase